jgi:hypothetical protein
MWHCQLSVLIVFMWKSNTGKALHLSVSSQGFKVWPSEVTYTSQCLPDETQYVVLAFGCRTVVGPEI